MADLTIDIDILTKRFKNAIKTVESDLAKLQKTAKGTQQTFTTQFDPIFGTVSKADTSLGGITKTAGITSAAMAGLGASVLAVGGLVVKGTQEFIEYEVALVGVSKTTDLAGAELNQFGKEIQDLSGKIPLSTNKLLSLAQTAGQLGVRGSENLQLFTETLAKLEVATDVTGEEGGKNILRILELSKEGAQEVDNFAASLVFLGNNAKATESEILRVANEVSRATTQFGVSSAEVLGISTALRETGAQAQLGGSVIGRTLRELDQIIQENGLRFQQLQKILGQNGDIIQANFGAQPTKVLVQFLRSLEGLASQGIGTSRALESLGLKGDEVNKVLPALVTNVDLLEERLGQATKEFENNTALNIEAEKAFSTLDASIQRLKNNFTNLATTIGEAVAPAVKTVVDGINSLIGPSETTAEKLDSVNKRLDDLKENAKEGFTSPIVAGLEEYRKKLIETQAEEEKLALFKGVDDDIDAQIAAAKQALRGTGAGDAPDLVGDTGKREEDAGPISEASEVKRQREINIELKRLAQERALEEEEARLLLKQTEEELTATELEDLQDIQLAKIQIQADAETQKATLIADSTTKNLKLQQIAQKEELALDKKTNEQKRQNREKDLADERRAQQTKLQIATTFAEAGLALAKQGSGEARAIQSAIALINTYSAANAALAPPPLGAGPVLGPALAAATIVKGLANVAKINSSGNFQEGGIIPGTSFGGDNLTANVNSGEMILNRNQQQRLLNIVRGREPVESQPEQSNASDIASAVANAVSGVTVVLQADDTEIARSVSRGVDNGIVIGSS